MQTKATESVVVNKDVETVYNLWADFEKFPRFIKILSSVEKTGDRISHWTAQGPFGIRIEWDAEITVMDKNEQIAWQSTQGDINNSGDVRFEKMAPDQTEVTLTIHYIPGKGLAEPIFKFLFGNVQKHLRDILQKFKEYAEQN